MNEDGNDVWVLKINNARLSDSGSYECQVSYHDDMEKKLKMPVYLRVLGIYIYFHNLINTKKKTNHMKYYNRLVTIEGSIYFRFTCKN